LPPVIIERFERGEYIDLIVRAEDSYKEHRRLKPEQAIFYNYLAIKLVNSLNRAKKKLRVHG